MTSCNVTVAACIEEGTENDHLFFILQFALVGSLSLASCKQDSRHTQQWCIQQIHSLLSYSVVDTKIQLHGEGLLDLCGQSHVITYLKGCLGVGSAS